MKLPVVSGKEVIKAFSKAGFGIVGRKGSHVRMRKISDGKAVILIIPDHRELAIGTLKDIIKQSGMTTERVLELLG